MFREIFKEHECPNCGSKATYTVTPLRICFVTAITLILFAWMPLTWLVWEYLIYATIGSALIAPFIKIKVGICKTCKYQWFLK